MKLRHLLIQKDAYLAAFFAIAYLSYQFMEHLKSPILNIFPPPIRRTIFQGIHESFQRSRESICHSLPDLHGDKLRREYIYLPLRLQQISPFRVFFLVRIDLALPIHLLILLLALNHHLDITCRLFQLKNMDSRLRGNDRQISHSLYGKHKLSTMAPLENPYFFTY